eukprot:14057880-Alexandrium_andersonii.AAC.1
MSGGAPEGPPGLIQATTRLSEVSRRALHHPRALHRQLQHPQRRQQRSCRRALLAWTGARPARPSSLWPARGRFELSSGPPGRPVGKGD